MNVIGTLSLLWQLLKATVENEMVNTAMDHWVGGTSNKVDDWLWALLEQVVGVHDAAERHTAFAEGLAELQVKYDSAKTDGSLGDLKASTRTWAPPAGEDIRLVLACERLSTENMA